MHTPHFSPKRRSQHAQSTFLLTSTTYRPTLPIVQEVGIETIHATACKHPTTSKVTRCRKDHGSLPESEGGTQEAVRGLHAQGQAAEERDWQGGTQF